MNIQIFGRKKCKETKKAERFFKERNLKFQSIDLSKKSMSFGELNHVLRYLSFDELIQENHPKYQESLIAYTSDLEQKKGLLLENPELFKTPIVRNQKDASVGYQPDQWKAWLK
jgi:arsenate reductase-like glutaredoxin family protein